MKDKTKYFIDLSKCSEEERKHIFSLLPEPEKPDYYAVYNNYKYLQFIPASKFGNDRWMVDKQAFDKQELTYPEFIKLFDGGEQTDEKGRPMTYWGGKENKLFEREEERTELLPDVAYWRHRCLLAEKCLSVSPCDPDITEGQIKAHKDYNQYLETFGNKD